MRAAVLALRKSGQGQQDFTLLSLLRKAQVGTGALDLGPWTELLWEVGERGLWRDALEIFQEMQRWGVRPRQPAAYRQVLVAAVMTGQLRFALQLQERTRRQGMHIKGGDSLVLRALGEAGEWQEALRLFLKRPSAGTCVWMVRVCALDGRWQLALRLLTIGSEGLGVEVGGAAYSAGVGACAQAGKWRWAWRLLRKMRREGLEVRSGECEGVAKAMGRDWSAALRFLDELPLLRLAPTVRTLTSAIRSCSEEGQWRWATWLLSSMGRRGLWPKLVGYNLALKACERGGEWATCLALLQEIKQSFWAPDVVSYGVAVSACRRSRAWQTAIELLREMKGEVRADVVLWGAVVGSCKKGKRWEAAAAALAAMSEEGLEPDVITCGASISACEKSLKWLGALQLLSAMRQRQVEADDMICNAAASACERCSVWHGALEVVRNMDVRGLSPSYKAYASSLAACQTVRYWRQGCHLLQSMSKRSMTSMNITLGTAFAPRAALRAS